MSHRITAAALNSTRRQSATNYLLIPNGHRVELGLNRSIVVPLDYWIE